MNAEPPPQTPRRGPWGPFATIAFAIVVAVLFVVTQIAVSIPYLIVQTGGGSQEEIQAAAVRLETDGLFFGIAEFACGFFAIGLILFLVLIRRGPSVRDYLALSPAGTRTTLRWLLYTLALAALLDGSSYLFGYEIVPSWMEDVYRSAVFLPLLLVAIIVVAPLLEEVFFRGFVFEGLRHSLLGDVGTIVVTALVWASIHLQYEWFYLGHIFALGLLLGFARSRTGSLVPPVLMHSLVNLISSVQVMLQVR